MLLCRLGRDKGKDYGRNRKVFVESSNNGTKYYMQWGLCRHHREAMYMSNKKVLVPLTTST